MYVLINIHYTMNIEAQINKTAPLTGCQQLHRRWAHRGLLEKPREVEDDGKEKNRGVQLPGLVALPVNENETQ